MSAADLFHLQPSEFLNDTVIDLYLKKLERVRDTRSLLCALCASGRCIVRLPRPALQELSELMSKRVHFFNTFFYKKLAQRHVNTENSGKAQVRDADGFKAFERAAHDRVKNWTKHVDIFSKVRLSLRARCAFASTSSRCRPCDLNTQDFVFVPVHSGLHWSLAIICYPGVLQPPSDHEVIDIDGEPASNPAQPANPVAASPVTQEDVQAAALCAPDDPVIDMDIDAAAAPVAAEDFTAPPSAAETPPAVPPLKAPFILHLDSMSGGHSPSAFPSGALQREPPCLTRCNAGLISGKLRPYLAMEWERLALSNPESVPALSGLRTRSFAQDRLTVKKLVLPQQNNSSDCGCFLLTYLEVRSRQRN